MVTSPTRNYGINRANVGSITVQMSDLRSGLISGHQRLKNSIVGSFET